MNILRSRRPVKAEDVNAALEIERARRARVMLRTPAALDSPYERLHIQALEPFGGIPDAPVTEALLPAARSESSVNASLRSFAAERLWEPAADLQFTDSDSVAVLKDLLADSDPSVRSLAARALDYGGHYWAE